jgi:hypothetical protein
MRETSYTLRHSKNETPGNVKKKEKPKAKIRWLVGQPVAIPAIGVIESEN